MKIIFLDFMSDLSLAVKKPKEFYELATEKGKAEAKKSYASAEKDMKRIQKRIKELDKVIRCLYEDRVALHKIFKHIAPQRVLR